jgi:hypothetical protein
MENEFLSAGYKAGLLAAGQLGHDQPGACVRFVCKHPNIHTKPAVGAPHAKDMLRARGAPHKNGLKFKPISEKPGSNEEVLSSDALLGSKPGDPDVLEITASHHGATDMRSSDKVVPTSLSSRGLIFHGQKKF